MKTSVRSVDKWDGSVLLFLILYRKKSKGRDRFQKKKMTTWNDDDNFWIDYPIWNTSYFIA